MLTLSDFYLIPTSFVANLEVYMSSNMEIDRKAYQVLIIEDDQDDAFLLKRALNAAAFEHGITLGVSHSVNGLDALGSVARSDILSRLPAVIIVDLNMPVLDGGRFLDFLRADMQLRAVPAVVLTTSTESRSMRRRWPRAPTRCFPNPTPRNNWSRSRGEFCAWADASPRRCINFLSGCVFPRAGYRLRVA